MTDDGKLDGEGPKGLLKKILPRGLSGKLLVLTIFVIMLTEVFVFVPSVANFRLTWLADHFVTGEATSLVLEKITGEDVPENIQKELLSLTQTEMMVVRRDGASQILASNELPYNVHRHIMLEAPGRLQAVRSIADAMDTLMFGGDRTIRVYGPMKQRNGTLELLMNEKPLRDAMLMYAGNVLLISLAISIFYWSCGFYDITGVSHPAHATHVPRHAGVFQRS